MNESFADEFKAVKLSSPLTNCHKIVLFTPLSQMSLPQVTLHAVALQNLSVL